MHAMQARGEDVDIFSNPSEAEMLHKQFKEKKTLLEESKKKAIIEKYGAQKELLDPRLRLGQTEAYVEYSR
jgi:pre-mRNA-processing factor SLU7